MHEYKIDLSLIRYSVSIDYDSVRYCDHECIDTGICRCEVLQNPTVLDCEGMSYNSVRILETVLPSKENGRKRKSTKEYSPSLIEKYCIDRILKNYGAFDPNSYSINVCGGYYGQEIESVEIDVYQNKIEEYVKNVICTKKDIDKVKNVLILEYQFLLDDIKNTKSIDIVKLDNEKLIKNETHDQMVKRKDLDNLHLDNSIPIGIVFNGRLIDGYHRTNKALQSGKKKSSFIQMS